MPRAAVLTLLMLFAGAVALAAPAAEPAASIEPTVSAERFILDEYNIELYGGGKSSKISFGLTFGDVFQEKWFLQLGPRISWVDYRKKVRDEAGLAAGAYLAAGYGPDRLVQPIGIASLDIPFGTGDSGKLQATIGGGARFRVAGTPREHWVVSFAAFYTHVAAPHNRSFGDAGIAVLFAPVLYERR